MNGSLVYKVSVAKKFTAKLLAGLASIYSFRLFSTAVLQAYLQCAEELGREIYVKPPKELNLDEYHLLKLIKPFYYLSDSGDYWHRTFRRHLENARKRFHVFLILRYFLTIRMAYTDYALTM